jgi:hypothetical protein
VTLDDGLECYILEMPFEPSTEFSEYYYGWIAAKTTAIMKDT